MNYLTYDKYMEFATEAYAEGDKNFCVPIIYSMLTDTPVRYASVMVRRKFRKGVPLLFLMGALDDAGYKVKPLGVMRHRTRTMPRKLPSGTYILCSNNHVALMHDGTVLDWTGAEGSTNKLVQYVYKIEAA